MTMAPARGAAKSVTVPPGPRGNPILGNVLQFKNDTVGGIVNGSVCPELMRRLEQ